MLAADDPGKSWRAASGIPVVPAFDGYRAISICAIVVFHLFAVCGVLARAGDSAAGVAIWGLLPIAPLNALFIVSGFVLFLPTAARGDFGPLSAFALRRAARLLPAYWVSLLVAIILLATLQGPPGSSGGVPGVGPILTHVTMLQTPALLLEGPVSVDGVARGAFPLGLDVIPPVWTLSVEIVFCFVLPLIAAAYYRHPLVGLAAAVVILVAWHELALNAGSVASALGIDLSPTAEARLRDYHASQLPTWGVGFAAGMTGAWYFVRLRNRVSSEVLGRRACWLLGAALPLLALLVYAAGESAVNDPNPLQGLFARQSTAISLAYPLLLGTVMTGLALAPTRVRRPVSNRLLSWVADISYGVYLIHFAVIWVVLSELSLPQTGSPASITVWAAIVFPISFAYSYLSARFLERPIRRWAHRFRERAPAAQPSAAAARPAAPRGMTPAVTVVIPTHNRAEWLRGAIDSLLDQDYPDLEVLVVDDGSTDATPELLAGYARRHSDRRFRFVRQDNAGQARAINHGNELARGEILGYLSDDDVVAPRLVSRLASELVDDPGAAVAYPAYHVINEGGAIEDTVLPIAYSPLEALRLHDTVIGPGGLARRWAVESAGGWDPALRWMGDLVLWLGIGASGRAIRVAEPLASWRHHSGSVTLRLSLEHAREHLTVARLGMDLAGMPALSGADRAEALRNACLTAALFAGDARSWPGDRYVIFDLHRKRISAWSSGQSDLSRIDGPAAERAAERYRELVLAEIGRADRGAAASAADPEPGGYEAAIRRLRAVGAVPEADGRFAEDVDERALRVGLVEAAVACGAETDLRSSRYAILDRARIPIPEATLDELVALGYQASADQLAEAIRRRSSGAAGLRAATSPSR